MEASKRNQRKTSLFVFFTLIYYGCSYTQCNNYDTVDFYLIDSETNDTINYKGSTLTYSVKTIDSIISLRAIFDSINCCFHIPLKKNYEYRLNQIGIRGYYPFYYNHFGCFKRRNYKIYFFGKYGYTKNKKFIYDTLKMLPDNFKFIRE